jgi:lysophospholipase L1-like esterase
MLKYAKTLKQRSADPLVGHEHRPGTAAHLMGVDVRINSLGMRDRERDIAKPADTLRILMLGDSVLFGWGVPFEKTIAQRLEAKLQARMRDRRIEVVNAGVGNYNTEMEVRQFLGKADQLTPDIVILNFFINDVEPTPSYDGSGLVGHSYAVVYFGGLWDSLSRLALGRADWRKYYSSLYEPGNAPALQRAADAIRALAAYGLSRQVRIVVASYPELRETDPYPFEIARRWIAGIAKSLDLDYVDLLDSVRRQPPESLWVTKPDPHPNALAAELFATAIADHLLSTLSSEAR